MENKNQCVPHCTQNRINNKTTERKLYISNCTIILYKIHSNEITCNMKYINFYDQHCFFFLSFFVFFKSRSQLERKRRRRRRHKTPERLHKLNQSSHTHIIKIKNSSTRKNERKKRLRKRRKYGAIETI